MCGRFTQTATPETIAKHFNLPDIPLFAKPNYNVSPSHKVAAVRLQSESKREGVLFRWGLIPSWAKDIKIGFQCINAKAETIGEKPAFRSAFKKKRCLIVADGFYEWKKGIGWDGKERKQAMRICRKDRQPFAFAGLWEWWGGDGKPAGGTNKQPDEGPEGETIESCTIITTAPNELMTAIHNRMPVILSPSDYDQWLDPSSQPEPLKMLLRPCPHEALEAYPVTALVGNPRNNAPALLDRITV
jgi:putative SOS response-associated peptidase YedK